MDPKVKKFLDGLKAKGFTDGDIQNLAHLTKSKKAWQGEANRISDRIKNNRTPAQQSQVNSEAIKRRLAKDKAADQKRRENINGGRGNPNYRSQTGESKTGGEGLGRFLGDQFSKKNPKSIPNAAASGADNLLKGIGNTAKGLGKRDQNVRDKEAKKLMDNYNLRRRLAKNNPKYKLG